MLLKHGVQAGNNSKFGNLDEALQAAVESRVPRRAELVRLLLDYGANVNFQFLAEYMDTPILLACSEGSQELIQCLVEADADWTAVNIRGSSVLHCAVYGRNPEAFANFIRKGASIHLEDRYGSTGLHEAMGSGVFSAWILNSGLDMELSSPFSWVSIVDTRVAWITNHFKLYRKRFGQTVLQRIANTEPADSFGWSPLCLMAAEGNTTGMENLVELGARLDHEGSPQGSALMTACANRDLESVKCLVRNGASLSYISSRPNTQGQTMSCLTAAQGSASITNWLLVGRFTERYRITQPPQDLGDLGRGRSEPVKHWAGIIEAEFVITGIHERQPTESSCEYFVRLRNIRREMTGKQVPLTSSGRRTCRPSKLIPEETVHISPDDKRVPR
jgi:ankyrin repeat protein